MKMTQCGDGDGHGHGHVHDADEDEFMGNVCDGAQAYDDRSGEMVTMCLTLIIISASSSSSSVNIIASSVAHNTSS